MTHTSGIVRVRSWKKGKPVPPAVGRILGVIKTEEIVHRLKRGHEALLKSLLEYILMYS